MTGYFAVLRNKKIAESGKNDFLTMLLRLTALSIAVGALTPSNKEKVTIVAFFLAAVWAYDAMRRVPRSGGGQSSSI